MDSRRTPQSTSEESYDVARRRILSATSGRRVARTLRLNNRRLTAVPPEVGLLTQLHHLDLSENQLTELPIEIANLINLRTLNLSGNPLETLPSQIFLLSSLRELEFNRTRISSIPGDISKLKLLRRFICMNGNLRSLPSEIGELGSLEILGIPGNEIEILPAEIGNLGRLLILDADSNNITDLPPELGNLDQIFSLYLSQNPLSEPYSSLVDKNPELTARKILAHFRGEPIPDDEHRAGEDAEDDALTASAEQRPAAYRFGLNNDRVDTIPEPPQPRDTSFATDTYSEARTKTEALYHRLTQTNSSPRVAASTAGVMDILGVDFSDLRPGLLLSRTRSLEADRAAFDTEEGRAELFPDALAMIDDVLLTLRDLLAAFPIVREIEIERLALDLDRISESVPAIRLHAEEIVEAAAESGGAWDRALAALRRIDPAIQASTGDPLLQRSLIADKLLVLRNFGGAVVGGLAHGGRIVTSELADLAGKSWQEIKSELPKGFGTAARISPLLLLATLLAGSTGGIAASLPAFKPLATALRRVLRGRKRSKS